MNLMTGQISENLATIFDKKEPLAMDIFQILGALLCNEAVDAQHRMNGTQKCLDEVFVHIQKYAGDVKKQASYILIIKNMMKGLTECVMVPQKQYFSWMIAELLN